MRTALYTPSVHSDRSPPSGAATATEAVATAFAIAGHELVGPSALGAVGDAAAIGRAARLSRLAERDAGQILDQLALPAQRPDLWVTYGLRGDAPDQIGPNVTRGLGIPYVLIDPRGPDSDADGASSELALTAADAVISFSDASMRWATALRPDVPATKLLPFIDPGPYDSVRRLHGHQSASIVMRLGLDSEAPRLLCVSTMRPGDRLASFEVLVRALSRLAMMNWQLIVVGDGPARAKVEALLRRLPLGRVHLVGALPPEQVIPFYAMSDLLVAPSVGGTHGRVLLEAQATGLPVVAGDTPGVRDAVRDGMTGRLCPAGNAESMAQAIAFLLRERSFLKSFSAATSHAIAKDHHIATAAARLDEILTGLTTS